MPREAVANCDARDKTAGISRAQRFPLQVPLRYRVRGERAWRRGETENISSSGVLFRGECFVDANTFVDLCLIMPVVNSDGAAEVVCRGVIVRSMPPMDTEDLPTLAVKILHFRLVRP
ncbi:MAG TPA: PilZ domain-containing protein [Terriglobia bacterium]|nr:PilZ domain-containing protein [Terriglobia bacterium]